MTVTADKSTAYPVTIDGQAYLQQVFTVWSETWVYDYDVTVSFSDPGSVPDGTKIVDANNNEITAVTTQPTSDGYAGTFKVLYPASSVEGQSGNVQLSLSAPVAQYAAMYAVCQEKDKYGELQNYICDLDNNVRLDVAAISSYANGGEPGPDETALKIVKLEEGTELPLEGAVFSIYDPEGRKVKDGEITRKTVTNKAFSGILLHKIDADTRKGIYGVTFLLYDSNMNPVDQFTTDQNGYAYYVWFKNNYPLSGPLYDDVRFEPLHGDRNGKYFVVIRDSPHETHKWTLYTERHGFEQPEFTCGNVRDMLRHINSMAPESWRGNPPPKKAMRPPQKKRKEAER